MWEYVLGGAGVFGLIVAVGAWINGRLTRKEISRLIKEEHQATRDLTERLTKEIISEIGGGFRKMDERFFKMDERFEVLLKAIETHTKTSTQQHEEILEKL